VYNVLALLLVVSSLAIFFIGLSKRDPIRIGLGALLGLATALFFALLNFWSEMLWFEALGYEERFWTFFATRISLGASTAAFGCLSVHLLTRGLPGAMPQTRYWPEALGTLCGGLWGLAHWDTLLQFLHAVPTSIQDPIFGKSTEFYLFALPLYDALYNLLFFLIGAALLANVAAAALRARGLTSRDNEIILTDIETVSKHRHSSLYASAAALFFLLAWGKYLARYHLMYAATGVVNGPGWTDANIRLPAYALIVVLTAALGILLVVPSLRRRWQNLLRCKDRIPDIAALTALGGAAGSLVLLWAIFLTLVPGLFQWLYVEPNEITLERPYIRHNIEFTRRAFNLHRVEEREFPVTGAFTPATVRQNQEMFANVRLWDWRALSAVNQQFQEIRLYYKFADVDVDRYTIDGVNRQVMVSARELDLGNLPPRSQTFVNNQFKYTHGYGIVMSDVSEFTPEGLPNLLIKDLPTRSAAPELTLERPQIYYGELTNSYAVTNSSEMEFDYPSGDENAYIHYSGKGGVELSSLWRRFVFGWRFDGTRFFMSNYPRPQSRIMFNRQIRRRVESVAPFLHFDEDPYITLVDGRLHWIIDGYTTSRYYPYSQPFSVRGAAMNEDPGRSFRPFISAASYLDGVNYLRNSVKAVVDAFDGTVELYVFDPEDPVIQVWRSIVPELFANKEEMPRQLLEHVRYPADLLLVQGLMYAKYHMTNPEVFYNQEDLWVRATENYYGRVQPVKPYYIMWEPPGAAGLEFVLMMPFTPKKKQVLIGWMAGLCDPDNYGRFLVYKFPKEKRVLGPQQVETKIDQDPFLSGQLTLWDQRGSNVIRGNVLAIPVNETLLYVEPIYLRAETAAYPELRLVIVMHEDHLSYGKSFAEALEGLFAERKAAALVDIAPGSEAEATDSLGDLIQQANQAFENYLDGLAERRFDASSDALEELQNALRRLSEQAPSEKLQ